MDEEEITLLYNIPIHQQKTGILNDEEVVLNVSHDESQIQVKYEWLKIAYTACQMPCIHPRGTM